MSIRTLNYAAAAVELERILRIVGSHTQAGPNNWSDGRALGYLQGHLEKLQAELAVSAVEEGRR